MKTLPSLLVIVALSMSSFCFSQGNPPNPEFELPEYIPPTPEVASLGEYIETPVNEYTGIPRIGLPIYEIQRGRIKHSISLSYHAQGVKVEGIASRVGTGWSLSAGGMIHRQSRGEPDDLAAHGYLKTSDTVDDFLAGGTFSHSTASVFFAVANSHGKDYEPDLFSFSFGGYSGKFFFNQVTREAILEEGSPLKIEWEQFNYEYFKITTPDGVQYFFGADRSGNLGETQMEGGQDALDIYSIGKYGGSTDATNLPPQYVSTWFLKEIYDPISEESITFEYEEYNLGNVHRRLSSSVVIEYTPPKLVSFEHSLSEKNEKEYVVSKINFSNGYVNFVKNPTQRQDLEGAYALQDIEVFDKNDRLVRSFGLEYFTTQSSGAFSASRDLFSFYSTLTDIKYRLFLSGLREYEINKMNNSRNTNDFKEHTFEYSNPGRLPHRFSNAQDFWGFHNGVTTNDNLLPAGYIESINGYKSIGDANRQIDPDYAKDGVLTRINYPTGGFSEYQYESNQAKKGVELDEVYENSLDPIYYSYSYNNHFFHEGNANTYFDSNWGTYSVFTLDDFESSILGATQVIDFSYTNFNNGDPNEPYWEAFIQKYDEVAHSWPGFGTRVINLQETGTNVVALTPGLYRIVFNWIGDTNGPNWNLAIHGDADWEIYFDYLEETDLSQQDYVLTGGLRVQEIRTNDGEGNIYTTTYSYEDENGMTTGNLVSLPFRYSAFPFYHYETVTSSDLNGGTSVIQTKFVRGDKYSSDSSTPLATTQSSYTGYTKVIKTKEGGENGKTEYNFSFMRDGLSMTSIYKSPMSISDTGAFVIAKVPLLNQELQRGKLLSQLEYNSQGDVVQETINEYQIVDHDSVDAISLGLIHTGGSILDVLVEFQGANFLLYDQLFIGSSAYIINKYKLLSRSNFLTKSTVTVYDADGINSLTTVTNYFYDNYDHLQQTRAETVNSTGEVLKTKTYYAQDLGNTQLENEFRVVEPLKVETYSDNVLLATQEKTYSASPGTPSKYLPATIQTFQGNASPTEDVTFHEYNEYGRAREVSSIAGSGVHTVYIWGYDEQYPIAKIENATYTDVAAHVNISNLKSLSDQDDDNCLTTGNCNEQTLRNALDALRTLPGAMVTTYTYDPLVGMTSVTDPNGKTVYYEYDGYNRLSLVRDFDGNIVARNEYKYSNEP